MFIRSVQQLVKLRLFPTRNTLNHAHDLLHLTSSRSHYSPHCAYSEHVTNHVSHSTVVRCQVVLAQYGTDGLIDQHELGHSPPSTMVIAAPLVATVVHWHQCQHPSYRSWSKREYWWDCTHCPTCCPVCDPGCWSRPNSMFKVAKWHSTIQASSSQHQHHDAESNELTNSSNKQLQPPVNTKLPATWSSMELKSTFVIR